MPIPRVIQGDGVADSVVNTSERATAKKAKELSYVVSIAVGAIGSLGVLFAMLLLLQEVKRLPAPAISNNLCIDEKLAFMRERQFRSPNLMVLGSSVGWRSIDGGTLASILEGVKPVNGAFCGLRMHQIEFVGEWLLDRMPSIQTVLLVTSPFDFVGCKINPARVFDRQAADDFVFERHWKWTFYLRYFDPVSTVRNVAHIASMHNAHARDPIVFNDFGDGPIDASKPTLVYGSLPELDSSCFAALRRLATDLSGEGRRLAVVATPRHPEWTARFDGDGKTMEGFRTAVTAALEGTDAIYWDGGKGSPMPPAAFADALHIRWSAACAFTRTVAFELGPYLAPERNSQATTERSTSSHLVRERQRAEETSVPFAQGAHGGEAARCGQEKQAQAE
jgi:hypothetical protein